VVLLLVVGTLSGNLSVGWGRSAILLSTALLSTLLMHEVCDPVEEFLRDDDTSVDTSFGSWNITSLVCTSSLLQLLRKYTGNILSLLLSQSSRKVLLGYKKVCNLGSRLLYEGELLVDLAKLGVGEIIDLGDDWGGDVIGLGEERGEWLEETESLLRVVEGLLSESERLGVGEGIANNGVGGDVVD